MGERLSRPGVHDAGGVAEDDAGGIGIGAVDDELDRGGAGGLEIGAKAGIDAEDETDVAPVDEDAGAVVGVDVFDYVEIAGAAESVDELAGRDRMVEVVDGGGDVFGRRSSRRSRKRGPGRQA